MTQKEKIVAAIIGIVVGSILGYYVSQDYYQKMVEYQRLVEENETLQYKLIKCEEGTHE